MIVVVLAVGTVSVRLSIVKTVYRIDELGREQAVRSREIQKLRTELSRLKSPTRIREIAEKAGLRPARVDERWVLTP